MIRVGRMPARACSGEIRLRRVSMTDLPIVMKGIGWDASSVISSWLRLRRTFSVVYIVEISGRPSGIFGVYNFCPGCSAEISLMIFEPGLRRRGFGRKIFLLGAGMLRHCAFVRRVSVMVDPDDPASSSFWEKMGFRKDCSRGRFEVLSLDLDRVDLSLSED